MDRKGLHERPELIVGLGNPGDRYEGTRHNIGFEVVDSIASEYNGTWKGWRNSAQSCEVAIEGTSIRLLKPLTFMNRSGEVVGEFTQYFGLTSSKMVVIHDELDLPVAELRLKFGGGEAGHNGLRSISQMLSSKEYWRLRCGIGKPLDRDAMTSWVLQRFSKEERPLMNELVTRGTRSVQEMCRESIKFSQQKLHSEIPPKEKSESGEKEKV